MRINAISNQNFSVGNLKQAKYRNTSSVNKVGVADDNTMKLMLLSFKGNPLKKPEQIAAFATESNYLGGIYATGGLADVAEALPEAMSIHGNKFIDKNVDVRTFFPYYSYNDSEGRIYVAKEGTVEKTRVWNEWKLLEESAKLNGSSNQLQKPEEPNLKNDYKLVAQDYTLAKGEKFALITKGENEQIHLVHFLEDTGFSGEVERIGKNSLEMEKIPYRVFSVEVKAPRKDKMYIIHTPATAEGKYCYGVYANSEFDPSAYGPGESPKANAKKLFKGNRADDLYHTEQVRAMQKTLKELAKQEHGDFNPQNIIVHDRFGDVMISDAMEAARNGDKFWEGVRYVHIFHNPGRAFQGAYSNPLDFYRVIASAEDVKRLQASPNYEKIKEIVKKIELKKATEEESEKIFKFFEPYFKSFMDTENAFNLSKIPFVALEDNRELISLGNVSKHFGKEAASFETVDIARGLTEYFKKFENSIIDVVNGVKPQNMATEKQNGFFGSGTLNKIFQDVNDSRKYTPYFKTDSINSVFEAKLANKKNLINIISDATKQLEVDADAIAKVFFSESKMKAIRGDINNLSLSLGGFSPYTEGDILITSWGRPDPQKGFKTVARAFRMFLEDDSISLDARKRVKLIMGAGGQNNAFKPTENGVNPVEWDGIINEYQKISKIERDGIEGIFKGNAVYINGLFPNRVVNCSDSGYFGSRWEPCGITPLECYASGTPVISIKTGGAPDFIADGKTGYLTDSSFMVSTEKLGIALNSEEGEIDEARVERSAKELKEALKKYIKTLEEGGYEVKQKEFIIYRLYDSNRKNSWRKYC